MHVTASWGGSDVVVEVGEECRTLAVLKTTLCAALPEGVDVDKVCLEVGERAMEEEDVIALEEGSCVEVVATVAARAVASLRDAGHEVDAAAFRSAAESGDEALCRLFLDAEVELPDDEETPLHIACRTGNLALSKLLIDGGCNVIAQDTNGDTPLHLAAQDGCADLVRLLLEHGGAGPK
eukprot:Rhum_TRINITY_DN13514_c0_g2::Rhum_TRINITY_DN13514_c0_g2_i1::g.60855::m.60855